MEKMKLNFRILMLAVIVAFTAVAITSCSDDDDDTVVVDKTALVAKIAEANDLLANTVEGENDGEYSANSRLALQSKIDLANILNTEDVSQASIDAAITTLTAAMTAYSATVITPIAADALVAHWKFDEGTGTTVVDTSGNGNVGTLKVGLGVGATAPTWVEDHKGNAGKAIHFSKGSNIEIPYHADLNPQSMTIACWIKADSVRENNRFMGLKWWDGYKLQLQSSNKVFFTVKAVNGTDTVYHNKDNNSPVLEVDKWYHIAVTFGGGEMAFYIDGFQVMLWEDTPGTAITLESAMNMTIGSDAPNSTLGETGEHGLFTDSYFEGALDEVRFYKTALTAAQIEAVRDREK